LLPFLILFSRFFVRALLAHFPFLVLLDSLLPHPVEADTGKLEVLGTR